MIIIIDQIHMQMEQLIEKSAKSTPKVPKVPKKKKKKFNDRCKKKYLL